LAIRPDVEVSGGTDAAEGADAPLVSVVIPTFNRAPMLRLTLETVLAQDLPGGDFEVLVTGDACTDDSEAVVASFHDPRLRWRNLPERYGSQSGPNNSSYARARGMYIAHIGHDDFWFPWHLSELVQTIEESGADWVYPLVVVLGPDGVRHCSGPPQPGVPDAEHIVPPAGWLFRRSIVAEVGPWVDPATIPWPIDFDFMRRAALVGKQFGYRPRPSVLKFPSSLYPGSYRTVEPAPIQWDCFRRLRDDPASLEHDLLCELGTRFARIDRGGGASIFARQQRGTSSVNPVWWSVRRWLITHYGAERWPVPHLMMREFQERRLGRIQLRGLELPGPPIEAQGTVAAPAAPPRKSAGQAPARGTPTPEERLVQREARRERRRQREVWSQERKERIQAEAQRKKTERARQKAEQTAAEVGG
jgi:glycosyltransferase involved in cell wall biosynthesis